MEDIDIIKTKGKNRVIYKTHFIDYYQLFLFIFIILILISILTLISIYAIDRTNMWRLQVGFILIIFILISYRIYIDKKARQFKTINTGLNKDKNKIFVADFIDNFGFILKFHDNDYLRALSKQQFFFTKQELTIIFYDDKVQINIVDATSLSRAPSFYGLKKFIRRFKEKLNAGT